MYDIEFYRKASYNKEKDTYRENTIFWESNKWKYIEFFGLKIENWTIQVAQPSLEFQDHVLQECSGSSLTEL